MADLNTVHDKVQAAMDEADLAVGVPTRAQQVQALNDQIAKLTSDNAALQAKIDAAKTDVATAQAADAKVAADLQ